MTDPSERQDNEGRKFDEEAGIVFVKTKDQHTASDPLPVTSVQHTSSDLEGLGSFTVGTSAVEVAFTGATESIIITAGTSNTGLIFVGKSDVTNTGANAITFLDIGESVVVDYDDSTNAIYVVSDTASQTVFAGAAL